MKIDQVETALKMKVAGNDGVTAPRGFQRDGLHVLHQLPRASPVPL